MSEAKYYKSTYNNKIYAEKNGEQWMLVTEEIVLTDVPGRTHPLMSERVVKPYWLKAGSTQTALDFNDADYFQETSRLDMVVLHGLGEPSE